MKTLALLLLVFLPSTPLKAQMAPVTDSILSQCPCSQKNLLRAKKHAKYLWENGWVIKIKCHNQAYFFQTEKAYSNFGKMLIRDVPFKGHNKIVFRDHNSFGVSLSGGFTTYYRFTDNKWSAPMRPYTPGESLDTYVP
jgi:hypothetical protein